MSEQIIMPTSPPIRIAIAGMTGRMGQAIAHIVTDNPRTVLVGAIVQPNEIETAQAIIANITKPTTASVIVSSDPDTVMPWCDVLIDFSTATAATGYAAAALIHNKGFVCGTTGLDEIALGALREAGLNIPVLYSSNMSISFSIMRRLVEQAAKMLRDYDYDISIIDRHHRAKQDSPSGTAKILAAAAMKGNAETHMPTFASIRSGEIVSEHEVLFAGQDETISLHNNVTSREVYARSAVLAAIWLHGKSPGFYSLDNIYCSV